MHLRRYGGGIVLTPFVVLKSSVGAVVQKCHPVCVLWGNIEPLFISLC